MAELILEHLFFRIEIVVDEIDKLIRFAKLFPFGHIAWVMKYSNHPMRPFLKYFNFGRNLPDSVAENEDGAQALTRRRRSEYNLTGGIAPIVPLKRICIQEIMPEELDVFEDALESHSSN